MYAYPKLLNLVGWLLISAASVAAIESLLGMIVVLWSASRPETNAADAELNNAYYEIQPHWTNALGFFLGLVLAVIIGYLGYVQTKWHVTSMVVGDITAIENIEQDE